MASYTSAFQTTHPAGLDGFTGSHGAWSRSSLPYHLIDIVHTRIDHMAMYRCLFGLKYIHVLRGPKLPEDPYATGKRTIDVALPSGALAIIANAGPRQH